MHEAHDFFNEPYDFQLVLGITLVSIPRQWDGEQAIRHLRTYSLAFVDGPLLGFRGVTVQEANLDEPRRAHLVCDNLITKQRCLQMRIIPVVTNDEYDSQIECTIVSIRPYCFWVKQNAESNPLPYMLPKYSSSDVMREEFEAKMVLMQNNHRPLIAAALIGSGISSKEKEFWNPSSVIHIWMTEESGPNGKQLTERLSLLHNAISDFVPHPLGFPDEMIFMSDYRQIFTWTWAWDTRIKTGIDYLNSSQITIESDDSSIRNEKHGIPRLKRGSRQTGCIRFENNRRRWVVDLSVNGCRMQKCFHENLYGFVGGLQEARRWRLDYIRNTHHEFDMDAEERIIKDLVDKILIMDKSHHAELLRALGTPIKGYEEVMDADRLKEIIDERLTTKKNKKPAKASTQQSV